MLYTVSQNSLGNLPCLVKTEFPQPDFENAFTFVIRRKDVTLGALLDQCPHLKDRQ
jgi:hypothetical protein